MPGITPRYPDKYSGKKIYPEGYPERHFRIKIEYPCPEYQKRNGVIEQVFKIGMDKRREDYPRYSFKLKRPDAKEREICFKNYLAYFYKPHQENKQPWNYKAEKQLPSVKIRTY
jgi:hypothetical protein